MVNGKYASASILLRGGRVLNPRRDDRNRRDVLIRGNMIVEVQPQIPAAAAEHVIDAEGFTVMPGLVNAHTHAHNNLTKGMGDNWTLEDLRNYGGALYANRTAEDQYLSAAIGAIEMLKTGCTAAYEQFVSAPIQTAEGIDAVMQAYLDVGLRAVIAPAVADVVMYNAIPGLLDLLPADLRQQVEEMQAQPAKQLLGLSEQAIRKWHGADNGRIRVATAPVIAGECSDELWIGCAQLSREHGTGMHTHLAETKVQAMGALTRFDCSLVRRLDDLGVVGPGLVCGHAIWVDDDDMERLAGGGSMIAHNPASNMKLGSGLAPIREMLDRGLTIGIGTDGSMSSDNQNMFEAMRFAALQSKIRFPYQPERWLSAGQVFDMATLGGAALMYAKDDFGVIAPGKKADIVLLRNDSVFLRPLSDLTQSAVYCETGADVHTVIVDGRIVVCDGKVTTVDADRIYAKAQEALDRLLLQNRPLLDFRERLRPFLRAACSICAQKSLDFDRFAAPHLWPK